MLIDSKVKHCNSTIDFSHVKTNVLNNQLKEIIGFQNQHSSLLETIQSQITNLKDRVEYRDHKFIMACTYRQSTAGSLGFFLKFAFQRSIIEFIRSTCIL